MRLFCVELWVKKMVPSPSREGERGADRGREEKRRSRRREWLPESV